MSKDTNQELSIEDQHAFKAVLHEALAEYPEAHGDGLAAEAAKMMASQKALQILWERQQAGDAQAGRINRYIFFQVTREMMREEEEMGGPIHTAEEAARCLQQRYAGRRSRQA